MHRHSSLTGALVALALAGCASSPPALVALPSASAPIALPSSSTPGASIALASASASASGLASADRLVAVSSAGLPVDGVSHGAAPTVRLRRVIVPDFLDGYPVVVGRDGQMLVVAAGTEWAERPSLGVARVLRDALSQRLGADRVLIAGDGRHADADLSVELVALDPAAGILTLDARWSFACRPAGQSHGGRAAVRADLSAATPQAVAAATSVALSRLADALVADLRCDRS